MYHPIRAGLLVLSTLAFFSASGLSAQETPAPQMPEPEGAEPELSDQDMADLAMVCTATYDVVLANGQGGAQTEAIKDARDLARSIYQEISQATDDAIDAEITKADATLQAEVKSGGVDLKDFQATCDSLLMEEQDGVAAPIVS
ncbi:hypothetical protein [Asticcacaulis sp. MM231]|uniref:hypothetical protein n=1 Tax=Asticcacaulis sp. MM231 TaxID=3157666 RepID=UPI0032D5A499